MCDLKKNLLDEPEIARSVTLEQQGDAARPDEIAYFCNRL
jgi:hypothetical protein